MMSHSMGLTCSGAERSSSLAAAAHWLRAGKFPPPSHRLETFQTSSKAGDYAIYLGRVLTNPQTEVMLKPETPRRSSSFGEPDCDIHFRLIRQDRRHYPDDLEVAVTWLAFAHWTR